MDPTMVMLGLIQAAKLANTLAEQLSQGDITPEQASEMWKKQANSWNAAADAWFNTPPGIAPG